ncbi:MAG: iron-containing alcohol dehydrogenase [Desulfobacter sp.]|nr:MAG: iron-containing alcohol dehydrogenase [Desulfobacter sp.]
MREKSSKQNHLYDLESYLLKEKNGRGKKSDSAWDGQYQKAYNDTFNTPFSSESFDLSEKLLPKELLAYQIAPFVSAGHRLIEYVWPVISRKSLLVTEKTPFEFIEHGLSKSSLYSANMTLNLDDEFNGEILENVIDSILDNSQIDYIVGVGGGRTIDIQKFIGLKTERQTISFPTSLATHVYASPKIHALPAIKQLGYKLTIDGSPPHLALLDLGVFDKLAESNFRLIRTGLGDIMAFYTAVYDWKLSISQYNRQRNYFVEDLTARVILWLETVDLSEPFLNWVREYHLAQVVLCCITDWVGSAPASGSEHLFALCAEEKCSTVPLHGELVALGVLIMSYIQGQDYLSIKKMMQRLGLPSSLAKIGLTKEQVIAGLLDSRERGRQKQRYTILEQIDNSRRFFTKIIDQLLLDKIIEV